MNRIMFLSLILAYGLSLDSLIPKHQITLAGANAVKVSECPKIDMTYPDPFDEKAPLKFEVRIEGADPTKKLKYSWFVSNGYVKSGQGTASIVVEAKVWERQGLTATVIICGLPYECENEVSRTTAVAKRNVPPKDAPNNSLEWTRNQRACNARLASLFRRPRAIQFGRYASSHELWIEILFENA